MDSYSKLLIDERIEQLRRDAAAARHGRPDQGPALARRIGAALGALTAAITTPAASDTGTPTPTLDAYPYRG
jgi:hypothetical protein